MRNLLFKRDGDREGFNPRGKKADEFARNTFSPQEQNHFVHGTGHGIGLNEHENPRLNKSSEQILRNGMVFSVEPGLYYPGWGGIRIEDVVHIRNDKPVDITPTSKNLREIVSL